MMALVEYDHPNVVPIIDGKVKIVIPQFELIVNANVKQVKGRGVYDAMYLKKLRQEHEVLIKILIENPNKVWKKYEEIINYVKLDGKNIDKYGWIRYCSELLAKKIIFKIQNGYHCDLDLARKALESGEFA